MKPYEFLPHTADVKIRARGESVEDVFVNSALALKEAICGNRKVKSLVRKQIKVKGTDMESLLYNFLEEFIFMVDSEGFLAAEVFSIEIAGNTLYAEIAGDDARKYRFTNNVKAITYNEMFVREEDGGWIAQFVLDV